MIALGVILAVLGYWFLPSYVPQFPPALDHLMYGVGVLLVIIGVILWVLGAVGRPVGGRRYWY